MKLRLEYLRKNARLTQTQVANIIGATAATISKYELGKLEPGFDAIEKLCDYFGVTTDFLLGYSHNPNTDNFNGVEPFDYIYTLAPDGVRRRIYIPPDEVERFRMLIVVAMPNIFNDNGNKGNGGETQ